MFGSDAEDDLFIEEILKQLEEPVNLDNLNDNKNDNNKNDTKDKQPYAFDDSNEDKNHIDNKQLDTTKANENLVDKNC